MTITERAAGPITILDIDGRIAVQEGASQFGSSVRHALHQGRLNLVLNLKAVPYIDSTALGELVRSSTTASQMGGALKLLHAGERICRLLSVAKLLSTFEIFEDEAEAVASFQSMA